MDDEPKSNLPWAEQYRLIGKKWAGLNAAASILEETKSAVLAQKMLAHPELAVSRAEMIVKGSADWMGFLQKMVAARESANISMVDREYAKMKFAEWNSAEANARAEIKLSR